MALPVLSVQWSPSTNPGDAPSWQNIEGVVRSCRISRGRQHELDRFEAGTAALVLDNIGRDFDPKHVANVKPMRRFRIRATYASVTYDLFSGFAESYPQLWPGTKDAEVHIELVDGFKVLNLHKLNTTYDEERSDLRIAAILDDCAWPAGDRSLRTGQTTVQAATLVNGNALQHILDVVESENGKLFIDGQGRVVFYDRHAPWVVTEQTTNQGIFGDEEVAAGEILTDPDMEIWFAALNDLSGGTNCSRTLSTAQSHGGAQSLLAERTGGPTTNGYIWMGSSSAPNLNGLTPGRSYRYSGWVYVPSGQGISLTQIYMALRQRAGDYYTATPGSSPTDTDTWQYIEGTDTVDVAADHVQLIGGMPNPSGAVVYWDDLSLQEEEELYYVDLVPSYDDGQIWNEVRLTRAGGSEQVASDATSQAEYLTRTYARDGLLQTTDSEVLDAANYRLARYKQPWYRFERMVLDGQHSDTLWPAMLSREIAHRIIVKRRPPGGGDPISQESWVEGLGWDIQGKFWRTVWQLSPADVAEYWLLGSGVLGLTTRLAY